MDNLRKQADMSNRTRTPLLVRYWSKVDTSAGPNSCWPWVGHRDRYGYPGGFWTGDYMPNGRGVYVKGHRFTYETFVGPIPPGQCVMHLCDNPPCVNPAHLTVGTNADNMADRDAKGRHGGWKTAGDNNGSRRHPDRVPRGEAHGVAKLTAEAVRAIRARYARGGITQQSLGDEFGVSQTLVGQIVRKKIWTHI